MKLRPLDKKGVEISTNTIIVVVIALLVLVIMAAFFAGGMAQLVQKIKDIFYRPQAASYDVVRAQCESFCQTESANAYFKCLSVVMPNGKAETKNCYELLPGYCQREKIIEYLEEHPEKESCT